MNTSSWFRIGMMFVLLYAVFKFQEIMTPEYVENLASSLSTTLDSGSPTKLIQASAAQSK